MNQTEEKIVEFSELQQQLKQEEVAMLSIEDKGAHCQIVSAQSVTTQYGLRRVAVLKLANGSKRKRWLSLSDEANIKAATQNAFVVELEQGKRNQIYLVLKPVSSNPPTANQSVEAYADG